MFSLLNILLVSRLLMMSDRDHFWEADKISKETMIACDGIACRPTCDAKMLKDKKILFVVHGFNNKAKEAIESYRMVENQVAALRNGDGDPLYDLVIGYLWPGYDDKLEYYAARKHAAKLKDKMLEHMKFLSSIAAEIDVMAHSMGNRLMFEALNVPLQKNGKKIVKNFYSLAAAVDNESLEKNCKYFYVSENCEDIFIFHSKQDDVLEFLYRIAELDKALGFEGAENFKKLPENVQLIDCTTFISGHSQYFGSSNVYSFIRRELLNLVPLAKNMPQLKMLANGDIEAISDYTKNVVQKIVQN